VDLRLAGRTALVTGASAGIGRGIALALAAEGVRLAITARRIDRLEALTEEIVAAGGGKPLAIGLDMLAVWKEIVVRAGIKADWLGRTLGAA